MISIVIPIFNFNVINLLEELHKQLEKENVIFEIICIEDASTKYIEENLKINQFKNTHLFHLDKNRGRSKIRNLLAEKAKFDWLLFLDSDVLPKTDNFISKYIDCIKFKKAEICFGGVENKKEIPKKEKKLRWIYGVKREEISFENRQNNPYKYFLSANFLIKKITFNKIKFNENIVGYGYEDLLFIEDARKINVKVSHLNNSVIHTGIDESSIFLLKTKEALANLYRLKEGKLINNNKIKILAVFNVIHKMNLIWFFSYLYTNFNKIFEANLTSNSPSLFIFDFYKLTYYCYLEKTS